MTINKTDYPDIPREEFSWDTCGIFVLVQAKRPMTKTKGGILLTDDSADEQHWMADEGIIRSIGPAAFRFRQDGRPWPGEGSMPRVGDLVRFPKYSGASFYAYESDPQRKVKFLLLKDNEVLMKSRTD